MAKAKVHDLDKIDGHELMSVSEFAKRIERSVFTVWGRIRTKNMPPGTVFRGPNGYRIDFTRWQQAQGLTRVI